ncbi:MAG: hypothetical protein HYW78_04880 [Parcubacteria group bacterium]|nr:hypothetical protein [Parcubacteria group bacterium]
MDLKRSIIVALIALALGVPVFGGWYLYEMGYDKGYKKGVIAGLVKGEVETLVKQQFESVAKNPIASIDSIEIAEIDDKKLEEYQRYFRLKNVFLDGKPDYNNGIPKEANDIFANAGKATRIVIVEKIKKEKIAEVSLIMESLERAIEKAAAEIKGKKQ